MRLSSMIFPFGFLFFQFLDYLVALRCARYSFQSYPLLLFKQDIKTI